MTAVPTSSLEVATDATISTGPEVGLAVRADPGAGNLAQGSVSGYLYPARWLNWIVGSLADWLKYVREAMPVRLSSTGRVFLIPIERAVDVTDGTPAIENPAHTSEIVGAGSKLGSGNNKSQPVLQQLGTSRVWTIDLSDILPKDGMLTDLIVQVAGDAGWGTSLPTTLPSITLQYVASAGGIDLDPVVVTVVGGQADTSATYGQFQLKHYIHYTLGSPVNLATAGTAHQLRFYLVIGGAVEGAGDIPAVYFFNARAVVTSKAWA
jgi:hypothetical protein